MISPKPSYEELEQRVKKLTNEAFERDQKEKEVERIFNFSLDMIGSGNLQGYFTKINSSFEKIIGYKEKEILENPFIKFVHDDDVEKTKRALADAATGNKEIYIENRYKCKDGSYKWIEWKVLSIVKENKFIAVGRDVTERKQIEKLIEESLIEKQILLSEIHHRVKNNLEIISSLLDLSSMQAENKEVQDLLLNSRNRIYSMAMIHSQLYQSERFDQVEINRHTQKLMDHLYRVYSDNKSSINQILNPSEVNLSLGQAIPCALVLNELITNAFKHAFRGRGKGTIKVSINNSIKDTVLMNVKDDGNGIPKEIDFNNTNGFGLKLSKHLVERQLKGVMRVNVDNGTEISIEFKKLNDQKKH